MILPQSFVRESAAARFLPGELFFKENVDLASPPAAGSTPARAPAGPPPTMAMGGWVRMLWLQIFSPWKNRNCTMGATRETLASERQDSAAARASLPRAGGGQGFPQIRAPYCSVVALFNP